MTSPLRPPDYMADLSPSTIALITGLVSGLLISIPVGPVNLTIMNEGARCGFKWAAMIALGATAMEIVYCALAFTSFAALFQKGHIKAAMEVFSFAFMLFLGVKYLTAVPAVERLEHGIERRIEQKLHPHSAFMIGFVRTLANPAVFLFWIILGANFISRGWVEPTMEGKFSCLAGVAAGVAFWLLGLAWAISLGHKKFSDKTMLRMQRGSGMGLILLGLVHGAHIAYQLAKRMQ
jgi:threonine/homoserine/homoserine lactone efflux protein